MRERFIQKTLVFLLLLSTMSCGRGVDDPYASQMKLRQMQTRTFVGAEAKVVMKELINLLQDEGYIIKNINSDLGVITAERNIDVEKFSSKFLALLFSGEKARWKKHSLIEVTGNLTEQGDRTQLRINYLIRIFDNLGRVTEVKQLLEEEHYEPFFNKLHKNLLYPDIIP